MGRRTVSALGATYVALLLAVVFSPIGNQLNELTVRLYVIWTYRLHLGGLQPEDFGNLLNVLMFVPLGALMVRLARWPWWVATVAAVGGSVSIELMQLIPAFDRVASVEDVITNGLGGLIGAALMTVWSRRAKALPERSTVAETEQSPPPISRAPSGT